jgi:hypothetical protein
VATGSDRRGPTPGPPLLWDRLTATAVVGVLGYASLLVIHGSVPAAMFDRLGFGMTASGISDGPARSHVLLLYGVLGAVLIGWMLLLLAVVLGPLRRRERWAWNAVTLSMTLWFLIDTTFSLLIGSPAHAVFNVPFAVAIGVPMAAIRMRWAAA